MAFVSTDYEQATYKARGKQIEIQNLFITKRNDDTKGRRFVARFKFEGKIYTKYLGYTKTDKLTPKKANELLKEYKRDIEAGYTSTDKITLNKLFELYTDTLDKNKRWYYDLVGVYERYVKHKVIDKGVRKNIDRKLSLVGKKEISKIREMDIKNILSTMKDKGYSPRTQKSVLEVLNPLFKFAMKNKYLKENPIEYVSVKVPNQKKPVTNASELFKTIFDGIQDYYKDNPFYQALFLFGFTGRRKGEILKLKWENIDLEDNYYWIEKTKNDDNQKYPLPDFIKEQLLKITDDREGLVFKSPITGKQLTWTERQMRQLKKHTGIEQLSLHYMRNVLVSALAEQKTEAVTLSGILGHKNTNIINQYLSLNHYKSGVEGLKKIDEIIDAEVVG